MTPEQKIKHLILIRDAEFADKEPPEVSADNVDTLYAEAEGDDWGLQDAREEVRSSGIDTDIRCDWSRHYESKSVATQYVDGSWVGWTYWYGGGKHGEPEGIDWMDRAYDVACAEEEKLVVVRTFSLPTEVA